MLIICFSSFNMEEVNAVMDFVEQLMNQKNYKISESDIGIVSPYKLQCKIIRQRCEKIKYKDIQIGTAEVFQGQERKVMIISTVQSGKKNLSSFLRNPQVSFEKTLPIFIHLSFISIYFICFRDLM